MRQVHHSSSDANELRIGELGFMGFRVCSLGVWFRVQGLGFGFNCNCG